MVTSQMAESSTGPKPQATYCTPTYVTCYSIELTQKTKKGEMWLSLRG